jgi:hypothetical protein
MICGVHKSNFSELQSTAHSLSCSMRPPNWRLSFNRKHETSIKRNHTDVAEHLKERANIFRIHYLMEEVIFWVRSCDKCCESSEEDLQDIYDTCRQSGIHKKNLLSCILVSKSWMNVALPHLWNHYAHSKQLVSLMFGGNANPYRWNLRRNNALNPVRPHRDILS